MTSYENKIDGVITSVKTLRDPIVATIEIYKKAIAEFESKVDGDFYSMPRDYWALVIRHDALVRIRILVENNFSFIETLSILATSRYICELDIWLKAIELDARYATLYMINLNDGVEEHNRHFCEQVRAEIALLQGLGEEEQRLQAESANNLKAKGASPSEIPAAWKAISSAIDAKAERSFCLYSEDAKTNGYGFQAHLLETQLLKAALAEHEKSVASKKLYEDRWSASVKDLGKKWKWHEMAKKVGVESEFNYIYSYTSRLLHAKPQSITTNQKNLELPEIYLFLRYCRTKIVDIHDQLSRQVNLKVH